jgi:hypothetical protein
VSHARSTEGAVIKSTAKVMRGLMFRECERSKRGLIRVQIKDDGVTMKVRKWNYRERRWGKWRELT